MKKTIMIISIATAVVFTACNSKPSDPQSSPKALAEAIFNAAKTGSYETLPALIADDADGDSKRIAQTASDTVIAQQFQQYFSKGKVNGEPVINGDKASVNILFGPDGTKEETFEMIKKEGKWYLQSF
jgi:hypothetical protein